MITAKEFYQTWCDTIRHRNDEVKQNWSNTKLTSLVIKNENSIVVDISERLGLLCFNGDFHNIDSVFYREEDLIQEYSPGCYLTDIRIAFEHENDFYSGLFQEVSHLLLINCDLKVVVSYPRSEKAEFSMLENLHSIISSSRISQHLADTDGFLFIMGHEKANLWKGWVYKSDNWELVAEANTIFSSKEQN